MRADEAALGAPPEPGLLELRILEQIHTGVDWASADAGSLEQKRRLSKAALPAPGVQSAFHAALPAFQRGKIGVLDHEIGPADGARQRVPLRRRIHRHGEPALLHIAWRHHTQGGERVTASVTLQRLALYRLRDDGVSTELEQALDLT